MATALDPRSELAGVRDAAGAWAFIRGFSRDWSQSLSDGDGCGEAEIRSAEQRLGITLPQALRDGYRLCGRRAYHLDGPDAYLKRPDRLLRPEDLRLDAERAALVYRVSPDSEQPREWAACLTGEPDPPVIYRTTESAGGWQAFLPSVSWAWVEMVLAESVASGDLGDDRELEWGDVERLEQGFSRLAIPDYPLWWVPGETTRWFGGQDVILREEGGIWLSVRCRTATARAGLYAAMPGDWEKLRR
jgi:hypothetical protein